jgi:periplasmic divalent cation tolerance protein
MTPDPSPALSVVLVTAPSRQVAEQLVTVAVEERLAACGNIVVGVVSIYRWEGAVQREEEVLIVFKTPAARVARLIARVQELHPYEVPEVVALPVSAVLPAYGAWVADSTAE